MDPRSAARPAAPERLDLRLRRAIVGALAAVGVLALLLGVIGFTALLIDLRSSRDGHRRAEAEVEAWRAARLLLPEDDPERLVFERSTPASTAPYAALLAFASGFDLPDEERPLPDDAEPLTALASWSTGDAAAPGPLPAASGDGERDEHTSRVRFLVRLALRQAEEDATRGRTGAAVQRVEQVVRLMEASATLRGMNGLLLAGTLELALNAWIEEHAAGLQAEDLRRLVMVLERPLPAGVEEAAMRDRARWWAARLAEAPDARIQNLLIDRTRRNAYRKLFEEPNSLSHLLPDEPPDDFVEPTAAGLVAELNLLRLQNGRWAAEYAAEAAVERELWINYAEADDLGKWMALVRREEPSPAELMISYSLRTWHLYRQHRQASILHARSLLHQARTGRLPTSWREVTGEDAEPVDRFGQAWRLRRDADGLLLYSLGPDGIDDGGWSHTQDEPGSGPQGADDVRVRIRK